VAVRSHDEGDLGTKKVEKIPGLLA
jgi:hypothetical protein